MAIEATRFVFTEQYTRATNEITRIQGLDTREKMGTVCKVGAIAFTTLALAAFYVNGATMLCLASATGYALSGLAFGNNNMVATISKIGICISLALTTLTLFINPVSLLFIGLATTFLIGAISFSPTGEPIAVPTATTDTTSINVLY